MSNVSAGLIKIGSIGDPPWASVELGVEHITITADGCEPISLDVDEARDLGNVLIVGSWLQAVMAGARDRGMGGSLSALLGIGDLIGGDDE